MDYSVETESGFFPLEFNKEGVCINSLKNAYIIHFTCKECGREASKAVKTFKRNKQSVSLENLELCSFCLGKKTNLEKYGVENPFQSEEIKKKIKETNLERYGVDNPSKAEEIKKKIISKKDFEQEKNKREETLLRKYGVKNPSSLENVKDKKKKIYLEKYGVETPLQSKEIMDRLKQTNLEKYGVENISQAKFVKEKKRKDKIGKTFLSIKDRLKEEDILPLFDKKDFNGLRDSDKNENHLYEFKCLKCGNIFTDNLHSRIPRCLECNPVQKSLSEKEILDFVSSLGFEALSGDRNIIKPLELDIVVPEKKLAIEFNGLYWHSFQSGKDKNYHLDKSIAARNNGYFLLHIFEDEWINKREIVESIISNKLGVFEKRIFARKCSIEEVDNKTAEDFFNRTHIQGHSPSSVNIGLFCDDGLVSCISFSKPRYNKDYDWEIIRFSNELNTLVVGGFSKLLRYFTKNYNGDIITYSDRRLFDGNVYRNNGFKELDPSKPNYYYVKGNSGRMSRVRFQKHKLKNLLENYDDTITEKENMSNNGYQWIYDCGNWVFELRRDSEL